MGINNSKKRVGILVSRVKKGETIKSYDTGLLVFDNYKSFCIWVTKMFKLPYCFGMYGVTVIVDGVELRSWLDCFMVPYLIELKYNNKSEMFILAF